MNPGDVRFFGIFALSLLAAFGLVLGGLWLRGYRPHQVLSRREWGLLVKLIAIALFALLLMQAGISRDFPAEMFIYGRF